MCYGIAEAVEQEEQCQTAGCKTLYAPLSNRVRGPYRKLSTEFFRLIYGPSEKRVGSFRLFVIYLQSGVCTKKSKSIKKDAMR